MCENVVWVERIWGNRLFFLGFQIGRMLFFGCEMVMWYCLFFGCEWYFFSLVILACSLWCLCQAVFCSWVGKKVFYWCSLTLLARIIYFCKINLFFDCLVGG